jgi:hypothetical protein
MYGSRSHRGANAFYHLTKPGRRGAVWRARASSPVQSWRTALVNRRPFLPRQPVVSIGARIVRVFDTTPYALRSDRER